MTDEGGEVSADASPPSFVARMLASRRVLIGLLVLATIVVVRPLFLETYTVPSSSMTPTLRPDDRIAVLKHREIHRGDLVVFVANEAFDGGDPSRSTVRMIGDWFGLRPGEHVVVKRVIALPGDSVSVDESAVLRVNGVVVDEPYLSAGTPASTTPFVTRVPAGRYFVMGDNRGASDDSRNHLGDPGGGSVRGRDIIGQVVWRYWPLNSWGGL